MSAVLGLSSVGVSVYHFGSGNFDAGCGFLSAAIGWLLFWGKGKDGT